MPFKLNKNSTHYDGHAIIAMFNGVVSQLSAEGLLIRRNPPPDANGQPQQHETIEISFHYHRNRAKGIRWCAHHEWWMRDSRLYIRRNEWRGESMTPMEMLNEKMEMTFKNDEMLDELKPNIIDRMFQMSEEWLVLPGAEGRYYKAAPSMALDLEPYVRQFRIPRYDQPGMTKKEVVQMNAIDRLDKKKARVAQRMRSLGWQLRHATGHYLTVREEAVRLNEDLKVHGLELFELHRFLNETNQAEKLAALLDSIQTRPLPVEKEEEK